MERARRTRERETDRPPRIIEALAADTTGRNNENAKQGAQCSDLSFTVANSGREENAHIPNRVRWGDLGLQDWAKMSIAIVNYGDISDNTYVNILPSSRPAVAITGYGEV